MIRIAVLYPNEPGKKFDWDYYLNKHMVLVHEKLGPSGLVRSEVDKATDSSAPFFGVAYLYYNSLDDCQKSFFDPANAAEIGADVANYTDTVPQLQISEIVK